jgi:hypothetical protein
LRVESNVVWKQGRYNEGEVHLTFDLSTAGPASQRKSRSGGALPKNLSGSVTLGLAAATACRIIDSGVSCCRLNGMLQRGLCPEQSAKFHNSEEHQQKDRHQKREFQSGIAAPLFP